VRKATLTTCAALSGRAARIRKSWLISSLSGTRKRQPSGCFFIAGIHPRTPHRRKSCHAAPAIHAQSQYQRRRAARGGRPMLTAFGLSVGLARPTAGAYRQRTLKHLPSFGWRRAVWFAQWPAVRSDGAIWLAHREGLIRLARRPVLSVCGAFIGMPCGRILNHRRSDSRYKRCPSSAPAAQVTSEADVGSVFFAGAPDPEDSLGLRESLHA